MDRGKINPCETDQNQIRRGSQGTLSLILQKSGGKNTGPRRGDFQNAAWLLVCYTALFSVVTQCSFPKSGGEERFVTTLKTAV